MGMACFYSPSGMKISFPHRLYSGSMILEGKERMNLAMSHNAGEGRNKHQCSKSKM